MTNPNSTSKLTLAFFCAMSMQQRSFKNTGKCVRRFELSASAKISCGRSVTLIESPSEKLISIAIDGPAGAGKSTTARMLAARLGYVYVDSGAMYRAVGLYCRDHKIAPLDESQVAGAAATLPIRFAPPPEGSAVEQRVFAAGVDITGEIRTPEIAQLASTVSTLPAVREILVAKQRALGETGGVVMEGRDIGTVVLPHAEVKIFLTASLEERAQRRFAEMQQKGVPGADYETVKADIAERDRRDTSRPISPLRAAADAVTLDSSGLNAEQVVDKILQICKDRTVASGF